MDRTKAAVISITSVVITMVIGSYFTNKNVDTVWYTSIKHPTLTPPPIVFPIVWSILYALIAWSFYAVLRTSSKHKILIPMYLLNLLLNILWCYLFFARQQPRAALAILAALWVSTVLIIYYQRAWVLILYLMWLTFAMFLNKYTALK